MPTTEEIRERLAKFAGLAIWVQDSIVSTVWVSDTHNYSDRFTWQPDQDRNQIAMVEERLTDEQWGKYASTVFEKLEDAEVLLKTNSLRYFRTAPPLQCAQALYEVIGE